MIFLPRYEFKYQVTPEQADFARGWANTFCQPDSNGVGGRYEVDSLYLDTMDNKLAQQTLDGVHLRFKTRLRTYGFDEDMPVFPEIKRREGAVILKERGGKVSRAHVRALLAGEPIPVEEAPALVPFRNLMDRYDLRPRVWVRYLREAWVSPFGDGARLTVDYAIEAQIAPVEDPLDPDPGEWTKVPVERPLLIELKFNGAFPAWMERLSRSAELPRCSFSKYVRSAMATGEMWERGLGWTA